VNYKGGLSSAGSLKIENYNKSHTATQTDKLPSKLSIGSQTTKSGEAWIASSQ
jgi:hypothetical protein